VELVVAEVGVKPDGDQIYRISWDGSVSDEPGFVAFGGQADQVAAALKERFSDGMSLTEALGAALAALAAPAAASGANSSNGSSQPELTAANLEVAILDRARAHRTFRRLQGPRLEELITESRAATATETAADEPEEPQEPQEPQKPSSDDPPTGPSSAGDGIPK
jgi:proteasome alpha subunit